MLIPFYMGLTPFFQFPQENDLVRRERINFTVNFIMLGFVYSLQSVRYIIYCKGENEDDTFTAYKGIGVDFMHPNVIQGGLFKCLISNWRA